MKPKTQLNLDEFGCCTSKNCFFRSQCAQHHSAGDFRIEDGFRPEIEAGAGTSELFCVTFGEAPGDGTNFPSNATFLEVGSYSLTELAQLKESVTKKVSVTDSEYVMNALKSLGYNVRMIGSSDWDYGFGRATSKEMYVSW